jgi:hypothetical protein
MAKRTRQAGRRPTPKRPSSSRPAVSRPIADAPQPAAQPNVLADSRPANVLSSPRGAGLTEDEVARAAELEAQLVAEEREAEDAAKRTTARSRDDDVVRVADVNAPLSVRAAHEYAYVARDVRRIVVTGGLMVAILAVLYVLIEVMRVVKL